MLAQAFGHVVKCKGRANLAEKILAEKEGVGGLGSSAPCSGLFAAA